MKSSGLQALRIAALCAGSGVLLLATSAAAAQAGQVDIEKRLTPEQLHATGLDTLSPAQLQLLNRLLREESAQSTNPAARRTLRWWEIVGPDNGKAPTRSQTQASG